MIQRYSRPEMSHLWTDQARFEIWLEVETLALEKFVDLGIAPKQALEDVRKKAKFSVEKTLEIEKEVKHDVIAFLTNVAESVGENSRFLHLGMTSSDLLDTSFAVQLCRATDMILKGLETLEESTKALALKHKNTVCVGRSHGIHAEPTTFGLKVAGWYAELKRHQSRIEFARNEMAVGAISGPVGTFAHLNPEVEEHVCKKLGLKPDPVSTQIIQRDRHAALFNAFAGLTATLERICVEVRHLQRTEVREAEENFTVGQKGSSAMPHKRNPILSENVCGMARIIRSMASASYDNVPTWHERDISHSSVERVIAPDITIGLDFILARTNSIVANLRVYPENMKKNLELTNGLVYSGTLLVALAERGIAREIAYSLVQKHALQTWEDINSGNTDGKSFPERVYADPDITKLMSKEELDKSFSLDRHLAQVDYIFNRVF